MTIALILLAAAVTVMLFLLILQKYELRSISKQLDIILSHDTNEHIHSENGMVQAALINKINVLLDKINETKRDYNHKSHDMQQMMTNISHDLRTPLTSAIGYINLIQNSDLPAEEKSKKLLIVEQRLKRLNELINSFFEFSQIISTDNEPEKETLNLVSILQESIIHYYDDFSGQDREIRFECDKAKIMLNSNANMLMRIFDNLIGNAYKHGTGNLFITVGGTDHIVVRFENALYDSDIDITHIFDEFYTTDISRTKGNTGLGLAIAKQFTELLHGTICAEYDRNNFSVTVLFLQ